MIRASFINSNILSFKRIPIEKNNNVILSPEYKCVTKDCDDYFIRSEFNNSDKRLYTFVNKNGIDVAQNKAEIKSDENTLYTRYLIVQNLSQRRKGIGMVMHLNNVINMLENNLNSIKLFSLGNAVLFHSKCKFEPNIKAFVTLKKILSEISAKDTVMFPEIKDVVQRADDFVLKIKYNNSKINDYNKLTQDGNKIVQDYLDILSSKKLSPVGRYKYSFQEGIDMILTKEKVLENKDFYNKLFEKYNIDYEIKDPQ